MLTVSSPDTLTTNTRLECPNHHPIHSSPPPTNPCQPQHPTFIPWQQKHPPCTLCLLAILSSPLKFIHSLVALISFAVRFCLLSDRVSCTQTEEKGSKSEHLLLSVCSHQSVTPGAPRQLIINMPSGLSGVSMQQLHFCIRLMHAGATEHLLIWSWLGKPSSG